MGPNAAAQTASKKAFTLPLQVIGWTDINRLLRELEALEETLVGERREEKAPLKVTDLLNRAATASDFHLAEKTDRSGLHEQLSQIRDHAPRLQISFASEPSPKVVETLLGWLRTNVHPYSLLQIGLAPSIAAGCVLRTPNKIFDLSLRASFEKQKPYLVELIKGAVAAGSK